MKRIVTNDGRFAAGNPQTGTPGTMVTSLFMNDLQDEVVHVIEDAGLVLDDADNHQMSKAIDAKIAGSSLLVLPTTPALQTESRLIFVEDRISFMTWVTTAYYTGYRSLHCGKFTWGDTPIPRLDEIEAEGDVIAGVDYPSLIAVFRESGKIVPIGNWIAGEYFMGDMGDGTYRLPDMRDMFIRATGTNVDTANARALGSQQLQSMKVANNLGIPNSNFAAAGGAVGAGYVAATGTNVQVSEGAETRPSNMALHPRLLL